MTRTLVAALVLCALATGAIAQQAARTHPAIVGHRGASGYLPDHTIESYKLAVEQGADFIEPDFVPTRDGYLFARHENELGRTTNVAELFPDRKTTKIIEGREVEGWFSEDFTHDEMKTLRARQPFPFRDQSHNDMYQIPTLAEVLAIRASLSRETGRRIGVFPELKHPDHFRAMNYRVEDWLVQVLEAWALTRPGSPIIVQAFDAESVKLLSEMMPDVDVILLLTDDDDVSDAALAGIKGYADGIGPSKNLIVPVMDGQAGPATDLVARAHGAGLSVFPYTFRPEPQFLPASYSGDPAREYCQFAALGVDGLFTDTPDLALKAFRESCPMPR